MEKQREDDVVVEIISQEFVKPVLFMKGERIPDHPKIHTLSISDQLIPPLHVAIIFFYRPPPPPSASAPASRTSLLKASLAEALYDCYPLAGRMSDGGTSLVVDCNDEGALFLEARVGLSLTEFLRQNDVASGDQLLDKLLVSYELGPLMMEISNIPIAVKVTSFSCGGTALCASFAHRVLDMAGFSYFLRTWAAKVAAAGRHKISPLPPPEFNLGTLFPPHHNFPAAPPMLVPPPGAGKAAHARFVFEHQKVEALKQLAKSEQVQNPTAVEAMMGLIYVTAVKAEAAAGLNLNLNGRVKYGLEQSVNLRGRVAPPLSEGAMGNFIGKFRAMGPSSCVREGEGHVAVVVREIRKKKSEFLGGVEGMSKDELREMMIWDAEQQSSGEVTALYNMGSWCRFGLYETDLGWGNPIWVVPATKRWRNTAVLIDKPAGEDGDGSASPGRSIEMAFTLEAAQMDAFLRDQDLLTYAQLVNERNPTGI